MITTKCHGPRSGCDRIAIDVQSCDEGLRGRRERPGGPGTVITHGEWNGTGVERGYGRDPTGHNSANSLDAQAWHVYNYFYRGHELVLAYRRTGLALGGRIPRYGC
jgi:hypothetical protein